jgi:hypothetical protein
LRYLVCSAFCLLESLSGSSDLAGQTWTAFRATRDEVTAFPPAVADRHTRRLLRSVSRPPLNDDIVGHLMRVLLLATILSATAAEEATEAACLSYEPAQVRLTGARRRQTFAGPRNYEDIKQGDKAESGYYLRLDVPVCTVAAGDFEAQSGVQLVQLVLGPAEYAAFRSRFGRVVTVRGRLSAAISGHHHAPLLLTTPALESTTNTEGAAMPNQPSFARSSGSELLAQARFSPEPTVVVSTDGRDLEIKRASDVQPVRVPVLDRCGDPAVGEAKIRHIRRDRGAVIATYGKHCFAKVSVRTLAVECTGCD